MLVHGHALLYPGIATLTPWWNNQATESVKANMMKYIDAVVIPLYSWDVVNEVMGDDDNNDMDSDGVRRAQFSGKAIKEYDAMGQDYIRMAFDLARQTDPDAKLMLTDYGCGEDSLDNDNEKSDRLYRFVSKLLDEGVPIDGIGFQVHVSSEGSNPDHLAIARNFERFRKLGLLIYITEMDVVSISTLDPVSASTAELERAARFQGRVYSRILDICMAEAGCQSFRFRTLPNTTQGFRIYATLGCIPSRSIKTGLASTPILHLSGTSIPRTFNQTQHGTPWARP
jgi:endo-1,4-beta-xylanase